MTLINDYTYQAITDDRERELVRLAEQHQHIRAALNGRMSWWRRLMARRDQRVHTAAQHAAEHAAEHAADCGMATPQHRVAH